MDYRFCTHILEVWSGRANLMADELYAYDDVDEIAVRDSLKNLNLDNRIVSNLEIVNIMENILAKIKERIIQEKEENEQELKNLSEHLETLNNKIREGEVTSEIIEEMGSVVKEIKERSER